MLSNWGNPDYDSGMILTEVTGNVSSPYANHVREYIKSYSTATGLVKYVSFPAPAKHVSCVPV